MLLDGISAQARTGEIVPLCTLDVRPFAERLLGGGRHQG
jgi:hypothetical protein